jgi:hypothetical protein
MSRKKTAEQKLIEVVKEYGLDETARLVKLLQFSNEIENPKSKRKVKPDIKEVV